MLLLLLLLLISLEVLIIGTVVFWVVTLYSFVGRCPRFGGSWKMNAACSFEMLVSIIKIRWSQPRKPQSYLLLSSFLSLYCHHRCYYQQHSSSVKKYVSSTDVELMEYSFFSKYFSTKWRAEEPCVQNIPAVCHCPRRRECEVWMWIWESATKGWVSSIWTDICLKRYNDT